MSGTTRLAQLMAENRIDDRRLARIVGASSASVGNWRRFGIERAKTANALAVARVFRTTVEDLAGMAR